jgi:hypothetical protein
VPAPSSSPTALLNAVVAAKVPARPLSPAESISLLQALATVPDPQGRVKVVNAAVTCLVLVDHAAWSASVIAVALQAAVR